MSFLDGILFRLLCELVELSLYDTKIENRKKLCKENRKQEETMQRKQKKGRNYGEKTEKSEERSTISTNVFHINELVKIREKKYPGSPELHQCRTFILLIHCAM